VSGKTIGYILGQFPSLTETFILREIRELARQGVALRIFSLRKPASRFASLPPALQDVEVHYAPTKFAGRFWVAAAHRALLAGRGSPTVAAASQAWLPLLRAHPEICHLHAHFANEPSLTSMALSRATGLPFSFSAHAWDIYCSDAPLRQLIQEASFVTTCTQMNVDHLRLVCRQNDVNRINLVRHGLDLSDFPRPVTSRSGQRRDPQSPFRCVAIGRLIDKKGFGTLITAMASLREMSLHVECAIIGEGSQRMLLEELVVAAGVQDCVHFRGALLHSDAIDQLRQADALIVPSVVTPEGDRDGLPNVILEAAALGIPIIASDLPGIREFVDHRDTGLVTASGDVESLAQAIRALLEEDDTMTEQLRHNARRKIETEYDISQNIRPLVERFTHSMEQEGT